MIFPPQLTGCGLDSLVGSIVGGLFRSHREHPESDTVFLRCGCQCGNIFVLPRKC